MAGKRNNTPKQLANLMTFGQIDPELQREWSSRGGKARQKQRKERQTLKECVEWLLNEPSFATDNDAVNALRAKYADLTNGEAMTAAVIAKTINEGDPRAYTTIRDTNGEAPNALHNLTPMEPITINIKTVE